MKDKTGWEKVQRNCKKIELVFGLEELLERVYRKMPPFGMTYDDAEYLGQMINKYMHLPDDANYIHPLEIQICARLYRLALQGYDIRTAAKQYFLIKQSKEERRRG